MPQYQIAIDGSGWVNVVTEFDQWLRGQIKHGEREDLQPVRDALYEFINEAGLEL